MVAHKETLASSVVMATPGGTPLVEGVATELWSSTDVTQGSTNNSAKIVIEYEAIDPDTDVVSPFNFDVLAQVLQQNDDNTWSEIARQFTPMRKLEQGAVREVMISPQVNSEEGIDHIIAGFGGVIARAKSKVEDSAEGSLRVCILAQDNDPTGSNPFASVTATVNVLRYDS